MDVGELAEELEDIEHFVECYHRSSAPFIATFNIFILIAMIFDREVRVKVYRRYLLTVQVVLILTSVFLARIQLMVICDDLIFYMLGDLFGLGALELIAIYAFLVIQGQVAVASCLFFRHQQLVSQNGRLHFATRKMHLMMIIFNVYLSLSVLVFYFGLKPTVTSEYELTPKLLALYGHRETRAIFKREIDTILPILVCSLFQVPYLLIIFCLSLHIVYILLFKDAKMTKQNKKFQIRNLISVSLQLAFSFLTLAIPFLVGCAGVFRSIASDKPIHPAFRKAVAYSITCMSSHSFFNSFILLVAIPPLRKTLYAPLDYLLNHCKKDTRTTVVELDHQ